MMDMKWKRYRGSTGSPAIGAEGFLNTKRETRKSGLKALNDMLIVEEDPIEATADDGSGLTHEVIKSIKAGKLIVPDTAQYALEKYPYRGLVISIGSKVNLIKKGDRVMFARLGGMRFQEEGKQLIAIRERDVLALVD